MSDAPVVRQASEEQDHEEDEDDDEEDFDAGGEQMWLSISSIWI